MQIQHSMKFLDGMSFETTLDGHRLVVDADEKVGGRDLGPRPKQLVITALTGCTGMDVVSILKKMQVEYDDFEMLTETEMTEEHPKTYTKIHLIYQFTGKNLKENEKKIEKAVTLSQDRYCGVVNLLKNALELTHEIRLIEN